MTAYSKGSSPPVSPPGPSKWRIRPSHRGFMIPAIQKTVNKNGDKKGKAPQKSQDLNDCFEEALQQTNAPDKDDDQDGTNNDQPTPQKKPKRNSNISSSSKRRRLEPTAIDTIKEASLMKPGKGSSSENPSERSSNSSAAVTRKRRRTSSKSAAQEKVVNATQKHAKVEERFEVEAIKGHKIYRSRVVKYEIKWLGYSEKHNTWEPATSFHE
ncbi:hypothetical protein BDB00DRAFT_556613 [Zychaea mexicana]|uniref:uncharacterized protein n=1 Tax=Zychaea mexicana TaxID=64656 RepID=UPI0022FE0200|nr:uncharacterized protein BDB00DRAFT_556613 [Zychaea mexicana]KAI9490465.1 hypothetical protein BDB00DRAFT_556613 [Zychaea mexicana]